ncbi:DUF222 domain-containing protein [Catelliglobosispora koreensis]|uniref:DUF222 domain-containing protein n=1 Tax=Catelliglobosispora koreensis TaxID=129052 RepID=UPI0009FCC84D|nr:DUF222 domain-containing protein [Catelliglobosispora koreensis]
MERLAEQVRAVARAQGELVRLIHEVATATPVPEFAAFEVAAATALSRFSAENEVRLAAELCVRLPEVLAALCAGDLGLRHAHVFADVLSSLDLSAARLVAAEVLPRAGGKTSGQLRDMLRRRALAADPAFTTARRKQAEAARCVQLHAADDGTAMLSAFGLDATRAAAAFSRVGAIARVRRVPGDTTPLEQVRADVFLELLEGKHAGAASGIANLDVSLETLAGLDENPGRLGAYGPVAADIARQWAQAHPGGQWRFAIRDANGTLLQQGLTRARPTGSPSTRTNSPPRHASRLTRRSNRGPAHTPAGTSPANQSMTSPPGGRMSSANTSGTLSAAASGSVESANADGLMRAPSQNAGDRLANAALTRWIRLRDRTCRAPGCRWPRSLARSITRSATATADRRITRIYARFCDYHHRAKDEGGWTVVQTRPGHFTWTSPLGRIYIVGPEPP